MRSTEEIASDIVKLGPEFARTFNAMADLLAELEESMGWIEDLESLRTEISEFTSNVHGEVSELWEHWRNKELFEQSKKATAAGILLTNEAEEAADIVIRVMAYANRGAGSGLIARDRWEKFKVGFLDVGRAIVAKSAHINAKRERRHGGKQA